MTSSHDYTYLKLVDQALEWGVEKENRTGTNTLVMFGSHLKFSLRDGTIPLLTTKKMFTRGIIHEILWYLQGGDNVKYLQDNKVSIWDEWAREDGSLGPVYGYQWRKWPKQKLSLWGYLEESDSAGPVNKHGGSIPLYTAHNESIDQIGNLIDNLKNKPDDRRLIVSAWNVGQLDEMALPPCHYTFQCFTRPLTTKQRVKVAGKTYNATEILDNTTEENLVGLLDEMGVPRRELSLLLNQRSCDVGLGVPFNIVQYSIMLRMFAEVVNMTPGDFIWNGGDVHVYVNHVEQLREQLNRVPFESPTFKFARKITDIDDFKYEDFIIENYTSHPTLKMDVAV